MHRESISIKETGLQIDSEKTKYVSLFFYNQIRKISYCEVENFKYF